MGSNKTENILGILRLSMGLIFLWAFVDKLFGLGFGTKPESAWVLGGSPTAGFLKFGVHGPFAEFFNSLSGLAIIDWLFMLGLLFIGITLTLGIMTKLGSCAGALMLLLMYLAVGIQPEHHPFIDDHFIYFFLMLMFSTTSAGRYWGFGKKWEMTPSVQKFPILK